MIVTLSTPPLSRVRTFLFGGLAVVWFSEMLFTGVQRLAETWTRLWKMYAPENPQLAAALFITHAFEAPLKAGLLVLALFGLFSRDSSARTALFVSMSLVPPINRVPLPRARFSFELDDNRTLLSSILWVSFLFIREPAQQAEQAKRYGTSTVSGDEPSSLGESLQ
jgi:hypothetical protein